MHVIFAFSARCYTNYVRAVISILHVHTDEFVRVNRRVYYDRLQRGTNLGAAYNTCELVPFMKLNHKSRARTEFDGVSESVHRINYETRGYSDVKRALNRIADSQ